MTEEENEIETAILMIKKEDIDLWCISRVARAPLSFLSSRVDVSLVRYSVKGVLYAL